LRKLRIPFPLVTVLLFASSLSHGATDYYNPPPDERFKADLLVVVAHPDDETEIGSYLARAIFEEHKRVAVVFGTRGNSGGNAQGQAQAAALGAIREVEARRAVGHFNISDVWFLNGLDTPGQVVLDSLETWDHGSSLDRLVRLVRLTRPDVIITWLPDWVAGENHGDHQAAGVLATEAFDIAGNPTVFAEQLAVPRNRFDVANLTEGLRPWQPQKIYYMTDAAHTEFLESKGPQYISTENSPSKHESYARLAAEEAAYHLSQSDSGGAAAAGLAKDQVLPWYQEPVRLVFGKSYVPSEVTADVFAGVTSNPIPYHAPPGYSPQPVSEPTLELGGSWHFYRRFWPAHGIDHLTTLLAPEIMAQPEARFVIPFLIDNPGDSALEVKIEANLPPGWSTYQEPPSSLTVPPHGTSAYLLYTRTAKSQSGWKNVEVKATAQNRTIGDISIRTELDKAAMPE
jgi:LmbE family N-acetylglucosaminyl deacetylase